MIPVDVNAHVGGFPFRHVPHPDPDVLVRVLAREGVAQGWVGHLPSAWWRDPAPGNAELYAALAPHAPVLRPAPAIRPDWPGWERQVAEAVDRGAPAVRAYPVQWGLGAGHPALARLAGACAQAGLVLLLSVKFEDGRQRHPLDGAGDLSAAHVRALARLAAPVHLVVVNAGRDFIDEVHWALTVRERERLWFDFSWVWGPPEDHLARLFSTIGAERFVFGAGWPLRLTQTPSANLALLPDHLREARLTGGDEIERRARAAAGRPVAG